MPDMCWNMRFMATRCTFVCHENAVTGIFSLYPGGIFSPPQFESFSCLDQTCGDLCYAYRSHCRTCGAPNPTLAQPARRNSSTGAEEVGCMSYYDVQVGAPNSAFVPPRPASAPPPCQNCGHFNPGQPNPTHPGGELARGVPFLYAPIQAAPNSACAPPRPRASTSPPSDPGRADRQGGRGGCGRSSGGRGGRGRGRGRGGPHRRLRKSNLPQQGDWLCESCGDVPYASRSACRCCGSPKPTNAVLIGPDGHFPNGTEVLASSAATVAAGTGSMENMGYTDTIGGGDYGAVVDKGGQYQNYHTNYSRYREGDWICPNCGDKVFSYRNYCRCCSCSKPPPHQIVLVDLAALGQGGDGGETEVRPGGV